MNPFKMLFRLIQFVILVFLIMYFNIFFIVVVSGQRIQIGQRNAQDSAVYDVVLGVVFELHSDEIQEAFKLAIVQYNHKLMEMRLDFQLFVDIINTADAFKLSRLICYQFSRGVVSMIGAVPPDSFDTLHSYINTFHVPFMTPWFPEKVIPPSGLIDYAFGLRPDYHKAIIDTIIYYNWKSIIYIYESFEGLLRLQKMYEYLLPGKEPFRISNVKQASSAAEVVTFLSSIETMDRWSNKYVVLDSSSKLAKQVLIEHVRDVRLGRRNYHYFLTGLVMDERWDNRVAEFGAINITGFRVLDMSRRVVQAFLQNWKREPISAQAALMYDAVQVLVDSIIRLIRKKPDFLRRSIKHTAIATNEKTTAVANYDKFPDCDPNNRTIPVEYGERIFRMIKRAEMDGLTGPIRFNNEGRRLNFSLQVVEMTVDVKTVKIGTWYDNKGLIPVSGILPSSKELGHYDRNKTLIVSTIIEEPYILYNGDQSHGNMRLKGFCIDLAFLVLAKMEVTFEIRLVKDNRYGSENPNMIGGWDGLVGELVRKEVDLVIAPLTVNLEREEVIDFSKTFLSFTVKTAKKSPVQTTTMFDFLRPLSKTVWLCIIGSFIIISLGLFVVSRFSPSEWRVTSVTNASTTGHNEVGSPETVVVNEFNLWNSLWYSISSFLQQGSHINPRSLSGRILGVVWYFFAMIMIAIYTANMASNLTMDRIVEPLKSYSRVTTCPADYIKRPPKAPFLTDDNKWYGFVSIYKFFGSDEFKKPCEMFVSVTQPGVKDFAIGFPKGSKLRDGVNLALQALKDEGELQQLIRKWFVDTTCSSNDKIHGEELALGQVAGLFYVLIVGLGAALFISLVDYIKHRNNTSAQANIALQKAIREAAHNVDLNNLSSDHELEEIHIEQELEWNGSAYTGYYTSSNQAAGQQETSMHTSFTPV